jgi:hypothetical protein
MKKQYICKKCGIINGKVIPLITAQGIKTNRVVCAEMYQDDLMYDFFSCMGEIEILIDKIEVSDDI